jgi:hypothetical protein
MDKILNDIKKLTSKLFAIQAKADAENRSLTSQEEYLCTELEGAIDGLKSRQQAP